MTEEMYFDAHFDVEDTPISNYEEAVRLHFKANKDALELSTRIVDGEIVDSVECEVVIDNLIFSLIFLYKFMSGSNAHGTVMNISEDTQYSDFREYMLNLVREVA